MEYTPMEQYWIWLAGIEGVSVKRFFQLIADYGDARAVWDNIQTDAPKYLPEKVVKAIRNARTDEYMENLWNTFAKKEITCVPFISKEYPEPLVHIMDAPPVLYVRGRVDMQIDRGIAVIGTRHATRDGLRAGYELSKGLAQQGVTIVSGLARGIDTQAHTGCLDGGGRTIAVLGCGADIVYPRENAPLCDRILQNNGMVLSEFAPGVPPVPSNFPQRNRIISGLSEGVLLVEAGKSSGGLITTDFALEQGRDIFVVPGSIYSDSSVGSNRLLRDCAAPVLSEWDILEYYRWGTRDAAQKKRTVHEALSPEEEAIVTPLRREELSFDELIIKTGFDTQKINSLLTILELRGIIKQAPGKLYRAYDD